MSETDFEILNSSEGDVILLRYTGSDETVVVPDHVTAVADGAFINNKRIRRVDLRNAERVGTRAFSDCVKLESVRMGNVTVIGPMAFEFCRALSDIEYGELTEIGDFAFSHCSSFDFTVFPESITFAGRGAFAYTATRRADLHWMEALPDYLFFCCTSLEYADCRNARIIGNDAFGICSSLRYIRYGDIEEIGDRAFCRCSSFEFSSLPSTLRSIGDDAIDTIRDGLVLPSGIRHIGSGCFGPEEKAKKFSIYNSALYKFRNYFNDVHQYESDDEKFYRCESYADVTVLDDETGAVTGFLPLFTDTSGDMKRIIQSAFRSDNTFDYSVLDTDVFDELGWRLSSKDRLTYMRLTRPFELSASAADNYRNYLSKHAGRIALRAVRSNDIGMLDLLHKNDLISADFIDRLLDQSISNAASECTAFLLECKAEMTVHTESLFDEL